MKISREKLFAEAETTGFRAEILEKSIHLLNLLNGFHSHPFLKKRLALKGGTALNLFIFEIPRLSVDIDLNYVGDAKREIMLAERPDVEKAIQAVCAQEGYSVRYVPQEHAGGKWLLRYESALGQGGNLEIDVNFMFRVPLWKVTSMTSRSVGFYKASGITVLDRHELAAGKLAALLARRASRDLFDSHLLLTQSNLKQEHLRTAFVVYGAMNRKDWRSVSVNDVDFEETDLQNELLPVLRKGTLGTPRQIEIWGRRLVEECRRALDIVLPFTENELEFLDRLLGHGEINPFLLTDNETLAERIQHHPLLEWKAINVRQTKKGNKNR